MSFVCWTKRCPAGGTGSLLTGRKDSPHCSLEVLLELSESDEVALPEDDGSGAPSPLELSRTSSPCVEITQTSLLISRAMGIASRQLASCARRFSEVNSGGALKGGSITSARSQLSVKIGPCESTCPAGVRHELFVPNGLDDNSQQP